VPGCKAAGLSGALEMINYQEVLGAHDISLLAIPKQLAG